MHIWMKPAHWLTLWTGSLNIVQCTRKTELYQLLKLHYDYVCLHAHRTFNLTRFKIIVANRMRVYYICAVQHIILQWYTFNIQTQCHICDHINDNIENQLQFAVFSLTDRELEKTQFFCVMCVYFMLYTTTLFSLYLHIYYPLIVMTMVSNIVFVFVSILNKTK